MVNPNDNVIQVEVQPMKTPNFLEEKKKKTQMNINIHCNFNQ